MTLNGWFVFGAFDTRTLGVTVVPGDLEQAPAREFQVIPTPGRNGDILVDNQKYPNVERTYWVMIRSNFATVYRQLRSALLSVTGYARLTDTWNPDEFYEAYVSAELQPTISRNRDQGTVLVTFSRKPQRFLVSGEEHIALSASGKIITNPTPFETRPLIHLGVKDGSVGSFTRVININTYYIYIVHPSGMNAFDGATQVDIDTAARTVTTDGLTPDITAYVAIAAGSTNPFIYAKDFPTFKPGRNVVNILDTGLFDYETSYVVSRWYTI